jgi:hypothetical protein
MRAPLRRSVARPTTFARVTIVHLDTGSGEAGGNTAAEAERVRALRLRSAETLERAYGFLEAQTDDWALLRARVLCEARPASELSDRLAATQRADGSLPIGTLVSGGGLGFPPIDPVHLDSDEASIVGTLEALLIAADARIVHSDWIESAVRLLESKQAPDGAFRVRALGDSSAACQADVFWTGMVAGVMGRTPVSRPQALEAAGQFLADRFDPEAVEHDGYTALLGFSHFFTNVAHELSDEALQWCGRALEKGFRSRHLDAVATLRVLLTCDAQAMPGATFDVAELLERLLEEQARDGGFAELALGGPAMRTTQTFDAMLALVRLCAVLDETA